MKLMPRVLMTLSCLCVFSSSAIVPAVSAESLAGMTVSLVSPKAGTVINPRLPLTFALQLKGGPAATANKCDQESLKDFAFGAQVIDKNNRAKPLSWGISNVDARGTGGNLYGWSSKVIPGGIECSITSGLPVGQVSAFASFHEGFNSEDADWFNTEQTSWSGDITNFDTPIKIDIAWNTNGTIKHNTFGATTKGSPVVEIVGLTRGQSIDYEVAFQVKGTMSSALKLTDLYVAVDGRGDRDWAQCADGDQVSKFDNKDGTFTYTTNCLISLKNGNFSDESIEVQPVLRHNLTDYYGEVGPVVSVNVGKQGEAPCISNLEKANSSFGSYQAELKAGADKFAVVTTGDAARKIMSQLQFLQGSISKSLQEVSQMFVEVASCEQTKSVLQQNLTTTNKQSVDLYAKVKVFSESPKLQAKAQAEAKARAKKLAAEQAAYAKSLYSYGYDFVSKLSASQLNSLYIWRFPSPGKSTLSDAQARDWCSQLPRVVVGLTNVVGYPANGNFIVGCSAAAKKIRF